MKQTNNHGQAESEWLNLAGWAQCMRLQVYLSHITPDRRCNVSQDWPFWGLPMPYQRKWQLCSANWLVFLCTASEFYNYYVKEKIIDRSQSECSIVKLIVFVSFLPTDLNGCHGNLSQCQTVAVCDGGDNDLLCRCRRGYYFRDRQCHGNEQSSWSTKLFLKQRCHMIILTDFKNKLSQLTSQRFNITERSMYVLTFDY